MPDEENIPTELPPTPEMEVITESFSRYDSDDTPGPSVETGGKND